MKTNFVNIRTLAAMVAVVVVSEVPTAEIVWSNPGDGNWNLAANWSPPQIPGAGDTVFITNSGTYTVTLDVNASILSLVIGGTSGTQTLVNPGATLTVETDGVVMEGGALQMNGGAISGTGTLTIRNVMNWTGGSMGGGGRTLIAAGATLNLNNAGAATLSNRTLENAGTVLWTGAGELYCLAGAVLTNRGLWEVRNDQVFNHWSGAGARFDNAGTFRKTQGTGTTTFGGTFPFYNEGTLSIWQGNISFGSTLDLSAGGMVEFRLDGPDYPANYGRITASQPLPLTGRLAVVFRNGFLPGPGLQYNVISAPIQGVFQSYTAPPISLAVFINPVYRTDGVSLVTTDPTPTIRGLTRLDSEGQFHLNIRGIANLSYVVAASTDLENWAPLTTNALPASTLWEYIDADSATLPWRFYRVFYQP